MFLAAIAAETFKDYLLKMGDYKVFWLAFGLLGLQQFVFENWEAIKMWGAAVLKKKAEKEIEKA